MGRVIAAALAVLAWTSHARAEGLERKSARTAPSSFMRGMTVSCAGWGDEWGTSKMDDSLGELKGLGVSWVAIHPYGQIERDGRVYSRDSLEGSAPDYLARAAEYVRKRGMSLFYNPHLAYWGRYSWRGEITYGTDEVAWARFFRDYRGFIVAQARFAEQLGAPLFSVGVELDATVHRPEWKEIISAVRRVYRGRITYAANWDSYSRVPFWAELDDIGVQAYFPVEGADLKTAWAPHLEALGALSQKVAKPVVFTEIGYNRTPEAARKPWLEVTQDGPDARALRKRLTDGALVMLEQNQKLVRGAFWWKWIPGFAPWERDFRMRDEEAVASLRAHWGPLR
ncbi:MAG: hypothetical protein HY791_33600 [Deltaproteobacteria bacterium]|nr:hypothetical protein [Deltaproteobacteria bacterium]